MIVTFPQTVFVLLLGPFTFFNVQKTKYLQFLTSLARWLGRKVILIFNLENLIKDMVFK